MTVLLCGGIRENKVDKKRPIRYVDKAILIGNGLNQAFNNFLSWKDLMKEIVKTNTDGVPNTLIPLLDDDTIKLVLEKLSSLSYPSEEFSELIINLVNSGFNNFLTTNYTYEIEYDLLPKKARKPNYIYKNTFSIVNNYIQIKYHEKIINIWHLHGEIRKKSSIVLGHDKYGDLMRRITVGNKKIIKLNKKCCELTNCEYKTWTDFFYFTNLYIVGYGLDYSEIDIWWILEKRRKYNFERKNNIYFYPLSKDDLSSTKRQLFKREDITIIDINNDEKIDYKKCYKDIIADICSKA